MDYWEEYDFKATILEKYAGTSIMPDEEEWEIIYQCTADRESTLRTDAHRRRNAQRVCSGFLF